jgi:hypothetical protein
VTTRVRAVIIAGVIALVAAAAIFVPRVARRAGFFAVQRVEVDGLVYLDEHDVVSRLALRPGASVLDPLGPLQARASAIPGVVVARVSRRLPGTLRVALHEATPVALTMQPDRLVMLDFRARVLPFDPTRSPTSLPIAARDPGVTTLLANVMLTDPQWYEEIESASAEDGAVLLQWGAQRVRLRPDASRETLRSVMLVRDYLTQHHVAWKEIDARFTERIFVRRSTA